MKGRVPGVRREMGDVSWISLGAYCIKLGAGSYTDAELSTSGTDSITLYKPGLKMVNVFCLRIHTLDVLRK